MLGVKHSVFGKSVLGVQHYPMVQLSSLDVGRLAKALLAYNTIASFGFLPFAFSVWQKKVLSAFNVIALFGLLCLPFNVWQKHCWHTLLCHSALCLLRSVFGKKVLWALNVISLFGLLCLPFNVWQKYSWPSALSCCSAFFIWQKRCLLSTLSHHSAFFILCSVFGKSVVDFQQYPIVRLSSFGVHCSVFSIVGVRRYRVVRLSSFGVLTFHRYRSSVSSQPTSVLRGKSATRLSLSLFLTLLVCSTRAFLLITINEHAYQWLPTHDVDDKRMTTVAGFVFFSFVFTMPCIVYAYCMQTSLGVCTLYRHDEQPLL